MQQNDMVNRCRWIIAVNIAAAASLLLITSNQYIAQEQNSGIADPNESVEALFNNKDYEGVIRTLAAMSDKSMEADTLYIKARSLQELGENKKAIQAYDQAIQKSPNEPRLYSNRGLSHGSTGELKAAIRDFDKAIELDKAFEQAYVNRGVAKGAIKDWTGAISDFSSAIRINPDYAAAWRNRGILRETTGDLKGACSDWKRASELGQKDTEEWVMAQCK
jgi:tetratricopeptide (TPR) repeat protein